MKFKELTARVHGDVVIIELSGVIRLCRDELPDFVAHLLDQGFLKLCVDFQHVHYMDSSALAGLIRVKTKVMRKGGDVKLIGVTHKVRELLGTTKLLPLFALFDTEREALESFDSSAPGQAGQGRS